jgi:hypothetical protein
MSVNGKHIYLSAIKQSIDVSITKNYQIKIQMKY